MEQLLKDKVAVITGSGQGVGREIALCFAAHGARVITICSRTESKRLETKRICEEKGVSVFAMALDIRDYDSLVKFIDGTVMLTGI